jgi:hypothetical protein
MRNLNCLEYARKIDYLFKLVNHRPVKDKNEALLAVREYNREIHSFKAIYGCSIRGYVDEIANLVLTI